MVSTLSESTAKAAQFASNETDAVDYSDSTSALTTACHRGLEPPDL